MSPSAGDADVAAILRFIAEQEPLRATLERFDVEEAALRRLLGDAADEVRGAAPKSRRRFDPLEETSTRDSIEAPAVERPARASAVGETPVASRSQVIVYSDGASRGNPGPAGAGWVICEPDGRILAKGGIFLGKRTNNEAEYVAAAMGLKAAQQFGADSVVLRADSELMVRQLTGRYKVKHARIIPLFEQVRALTKGYRSFRAEHVPRAQNAAADEQANIAIDEAKR